MKSNCKTHCKPNCKSCKTKAHLHAHKEKYMFAGVLTGAALQTMAGVTFKAFLIMLTS